jgi:multiple sugar transport system substrate-binding protein
MGRTIDRRRFAAGLAATAGAFGAPWPRAGAQEATTNPDLSGTVRYQVLANGPDELSGAQEAIDRLFRPRFPNLEVRVEPAPDNRDEKLVAAMIAGDAPDIFDTWLDYVRGYAERGLILDVNPFVERDLSPEEVADFHPWQWGDFRLESGARWGMPKYVNLGLLWYNKAIFDEAGIPYPDDTWDHDRYAEVARQLTVRVGDAVDRFGLYLPMFGMDRVDYKVRAWGGAMVDPEDDTRCALGDEPAQAALEWCRRLIFDDGAAVDVTLLFGGYPPFFAVFEAFANGQMAMVEDGLYPFATAEAVGDAFPWAYAPVPKGPVARTTFGSADGFAGWSGTPNPDATWEVMKFLSGPEYQAELVRMTGSLPARASVMETWKQVLAERYPALAEANLDVALQAMADGYPDNRPAFRNDQEAAELIGPAIEKVFIAGGTPVSYFAGIAEDVTAKMRT